MNTPLPIFITIVICSLIALPATFRAEDAAPRPLASGVYTWENLNVKKTVNGERRDIVNAPTATFANFECHVTTLNPGQPSHAAHRHPDEEIIIVKEGAITLTVNERPMEVTAGSLAFVASNDLHSIKNASATAPATYHVMRIITHPPKSE